MHRKIFQFSEDPVDKEDYFEEERYMGKPWNFVGGIADYVDRITDDEMKACIVWLGKDRSTNGIMTDKWSRTISVFDKRAFFASKYEGFVKALRNLSGITLDEFCTNKKTAYFCDLEYYFNDKYGIYMDSDEDGLLTLDEWVRHAKPGKKFYIGAVIDYHW